MQWISLFSNSLGFSSKLSVQAVFIPLGICLLALVTIIIVVAIVLYVQT